MPYRPVRRYLCCTVLQVWDSRLVALSSCEIIVLLPYRPGDSRLVTLSSSQIIALLSNRPVRKPSCCPIIQVCGSRERKSARVLATADCLCGSGFGQLAVAVVISLFTGVVLISFRLVDYSLPSCQICWLLSVAGKMKDIAGVALFL